MDRATYVDAITGVQIAAGMLREIDLAGVLNAMEHADALGPILDPTLYKAASAKMDQVRALVTAALPLQAEFIRQINASKAGG